MLFWEILRIFLYYGRLIIQNHLLDMILFFLQPFDVIFVHS